MRAGQADARLTSHAAIAGERTQPRHRALPSAIGNRAFAQLVQRFYADPGDDASWIAGDPPAVTGSDILNHFQQSFKTILVVRMNGLPFGKFWNTTKDHKHAEANFIDAWNTHWRRAAKKGWFEPQGEVNDLVLEINNQPCDKCSRLLREFEGDWNIGWGRTQRVPIRLDIRAQNVYGKDEKAGLAADILSDNPNITLGPYNPDADFPGFDLDEYARKPQWAKSQRARQARAKAFFDQQSDDESSSSFSEADGSWGYDAAPPMSDDEKGSPPSDDDMEVSLSDEENSSPSDDEQSSLVASAAVVGQVRPAKPLDWKLSNSARRRGAAERQRSARKQRHVKGHRPPGW